MKKGVNTEKLISELFDFQRFERNKALQSVIEETETGRVGAELTDDELSSLSAAGDPFAQPFDPKRKGGLR